MSNYISNLLCHFVGRSKSTDDERFDLLVKIIKEGQLKANLTNPSTPELRTSSQYKGGTIGEIFERCDCVCFCDIPDDMLGIHTSKYSKMGMGFSKAFLSQKGVRPVTYVPSQGHMKEPTQTETPINSPMDYYLYINKLSNSFLPMLMLLNSFNPFGLQLIEIMKKPIGESIKLFDNDVLAATINGKSHQLLFSLASAWATQSAYIKVFDESLPEDHIDNYYMEREWRGINSIEFDLSSIQKIYLPNQSYKERFIAKFPSYTGEFLLFDGN